MKWKRKFERTVSASFHQEDADLIKSAAREFDVTQTEIVRACVSQYLPKLIEIAREDDRVRKEKERAKEEAKEKLLNGE